MHVNMSILTFGLHKVTLSVQ